MRGLLNSKDAREDAGCGFCGLGLVLWQIL